MIKFQEIIVQEIIILLYGITLIKITIMQDTYKIFCE